MQQCKGSGTMIPEDANFDATVQLKLLQRFNVSSTIEGIQTAMDQFISGGTYTDGNLPKYCNRHRGRHLDYRLFKSLTSVPDGKTLLVSYADIEKLDEDITTLT